MAGGTAGDLVRRRLPVKYQNDARDRCSVVSGDYKKASHATITPRIATSLYARHIYGRDRIPASTVYKFSLPFLSE